MNDPNERNVTEICIKREQGDVANTHSVILLMYVIEQYGLPRVLQQKA